MSIRTMNEVWENAPYDGGELLVLLALADWANAQDRCWPSVPAIARKARISERQVYNILRQLTEDGVIEREAGGGRGKVTVYVINTATIAGFSKTETLKPIASKPCNQQQRNPEICDKPLKPLIGRTVSEPSGEPPTGRKAEIQSAAQSVCLAFSFVGPEILQAIREAIAIALQHPDCDLAPAQLAESMKRRWGEFQELGNQGLLRYQWGPQRFFSGGHWRPDAAWPIDEQAARLKREAAVGMHR